MEWSVIYGSLTSLLVFLHSAYLFAAALLFGAAVVVEWLHPDPPDAEPLRSKARRAVVRLFARDDTRLACAP